MGDRSLRHAVHAVLAQVDLGKHPDLPSIQSALETNSGRPIEIIEFPDFREGNLCGLWVAFEDRDVVLHGPPASSWHLQQIILHEFAHMILGHNLTATSLSLTSVPGFAGTPLKTLGRSSFDDDAEAAAEYLADLLAARIVAGTPEPPDDPAGFSKVFG